MIASRWFRPIILAATLALAAPTFAEDYWDNDDWDMADAQAQLSEAIGDLPVYEIRVDRYGILVYAGDPSVNDGLRERKSLPDIDERSGPRRGRSEHLNLPR